MAALTLGGPVLAIRWSHAVQVAFRSLVAARWNAVAAVLVLSVAAAAGHAVTSIWNSTVGHRFSWRAEEVVAITLEGAGDQGREEFAPYPTDAEVELLRESASLTWIGHAAPRLPLSVGGPGRARLVPAAELAPGTLEALGASPAAGRGLYDAGSRNAGAGTGAPAPVLLRADLAAFVFGSVEGAVGRRLTLGRRRAEVVGVMPNDFVFPAADFAVWLTAAPAAGEIDFPISRASTYARLAPGVSAGAAAAEARAILRRAGDRARGERIVLTPFPEQITAEIRPTLEVLLTGALLLLVAAAAGVASLRLSQALAEQRVSGIRRAMGATPEDEMAAAGFRILLLAVPVAGGALALSTVLLPLLRRYGANLLFADEWAAGSGAAVEAFLAAAVAVTLAEIPSLVEIRRERSSAVTTGARGAVDRRPFLLPLLAAGTAASTVILVATAVLAGSAWTLLAGRGGYPDAGLGVLTVDFGGRGPGPTLPPAERRRILDALVARIEARPDIRAAGYGDGLPDDQTAIFYAFGDDPNDADVRLSVRRVSPGLLETLRIPVLRGRGLRASDGDSGEIAALVSRGFAEHAAEDPLGELISLGRDRRRVVGVTAEVATFPVEARWPTLYLPFTGDPGLIARAAGMDKRTVEVAVRFRGGLSAEKLETLASVPKTVDPSLRVLQSRSVRDRRTELLGSSALGSAVLVVFAAAGLLLTVVGVVGHIADTSAREAQPNAVRLAFGAEPAVILGQVVRRTGMAAGAGIGAGLLLGWLLARAIGSRIPWVETGDFFLYLGPALLAALLVMAGCLRAGWKAARSDPWALLRSL